MTEQQVDSLEQRYKLRAVASRINEQYYLLDKRKIAIALPEYVKVTKIKSSLVIGLTKEQAKILAQELLGVLETFY